MTEDALGDEAELDLSGALDDGELARVTVEHLDRVLFHVAGRTEQLHREARRLHRDLRGVVLHIERKGTYSLVKQPGGAPRSAIGQQSRRLDLGRALRDLPLDALELCDRLAEGRAVLAYSVAYIRAPSARPSPRAATIGRIALSDCMTRAKPPPITWSNT